MAIHVQVRYTTCSKVNLKKLEDNEVFSSPLLSFGSRCQKRPSEVSVDTDTSEGQTRKQETYRGGSTKLSKRRETFP